MSKQHHYLRPGEQTFSLAHGSVEYRLSNPLLVLAGGVYPLELNVQTHTATVSWDPHDCRADDAAKLSQWLHTRSGIAVWQCQDLAQAGKTWTTPKLAADGTPTPKQHWSMSDGPVRVITDPDEVRVNVDEEVTRFRVGLNRRGMAFVCSDAATARIKKAVAKAGTGASYEFDYATQEAVILKPVMTMPLPQWEALQTANLYVQPQKIPIGRRGEFVRGPFKGYASAVTAAIAYLAELDEKVHYQVLILLGDGPSRPLVRWLSRKTKPWIPAAENETDGKAKTQDAGGQAG